MELNLSIKDLDLLTSKTNKIHVRIQQNGKRKLTIIQGLDDDLDHKRIMKAMKKVFNCNGSVTSDEEYGDVIQLQGDQRETAIDWLIVQEILTEQDRKDRIVIHGS
jgi:translation initiation factor 1